MVQTHLILSNCFFFFFLFNILIVQTFELKKNHSHCFLDQTSESNVKIKQACHFSIVIKGLEQICLCEILGFTIH